MADKKNPTRGFNRRPGRGDFGVRRAAELT